MNAHKFVAEKGIDEAKRVLSQAKPDSKIYDLISNQYQESRVTAIPVGCPMYPTYRAVEVKEFIVLSELKQVVDSIYMVGDFGTLDKAKKYAVSDYTAPEVKHRLEKSIADYELVESFKYGALTNKGTKCEVLDMVDVSPRCEVRNG